MSLYSFGLREKAIARRANKTDVSIHGWLGVKDSMELNPDTSIDILSLCRVRRRKQITLFVGGVVEAGDRYSFADELARISEKLRDGDVWAGRCARNERY